jgi:outer membrane biosynthesis protein TonB
MSQSAAASGMLAALATSVLDAPRSGPSGALAWAGFGACALHVLLLGAALTAGKHRALEHDVSAMSAVSKLEVELVEPPPPPEPEPEAPPPPPPPQAAAAPKPVRAAPKPTPAPPKEAPPPAAAESGKLLAAEAVDFGDSFVMGNAASHAGGVSANAGTSKQAVHDRNAQANGVVGGTGKNPAADATRAPSLASGLQWDCPFPVEADDAGIDTAVVGLRVEVAADGKVREARALSDPGHGFAREARRCALSKRWAPGLDRAGNPTLAIALVKVRFER